MDVELPKAPVRELTPDLFADITSIPYTTASEDSEWANLTTDLTSVLVFAGDLTDQERQRVIWRATTTPNEETILRAARSIMADLRTIRDSTGNLSAANLSNAVRVLARAMIGVIRLLIRDLDGTD